MIRRITAEFEYANIEYRICDKKLEVADSETGEWRAVEDSQKSRDFLVQMVIEGYFKSCEKTIEDFSGGLKFSGFGSTGHEYWFIFESSTTPNVQGKLYYRDPADGPINLVNQSSELANAAVNGLYALLTKNSVKDKAKIEGLRLDLEEAQKMVVALGDGHREWQSRALSAEQKEEQYRLEIEQLKKELKELSVENKCSDWSELD